MWSMDVRRASRRERTRAEEGMSGSRLTARWKREVSSMLDSRSERRIVVASRETGRFVASAADERSDFIVVRATQSSVRERHIPSALSFN